MDVAGIKRALAEARPSVQANVAAMDLGKLRAEVEYREKEAAQVSDDKLMG
jgi:hypothetical protein